MPHERLEMDRDVSEINVEKLRLVSVEQALKAPHFRGRNLPGRITQRAKPKTSQKMGGRLSHEKDRLEGKPLRFLALLCDDDRPKAFQGRDLPIDVQHLRL